jgi:hypothetical protein
MSETLMLAAIFAPLVLVPAFIVSFMSHVDGLRWPHTEILLEFGDFEPSPFLEFERVMRDEIVKLFDIPAPVLDAAPGEEIRRRFEVMMLGVVFAPADDCK